MSDGQVTVEVDHIAAPGTLPPDLDGVVIEGAAIVPAGTSIVGARLSDIATPPCSGGVASRATQASSSSRGASAPPGAPPRIRFAFLRAQVEQAHLLASELAALDLSITEEGRPESSRCLRIALRTAPSGADWQATPTFSSLELRPFVLGRSLPSYRWGGGFFSIGGGTWAGGWRLAVALEIGAIELSSPPASQARSHVAFAGGALEVNRILLDRGRSALDLGLSYDVLGVEDGPGASAPATALHGPRATLRWVFLAGRIDWRGFRAPPDTTALALGAFAGAWWQGFEQLAPAPIFGLSLEGNLGSALFLIP